MKRTLALIVASAFLASSNIQTAILRNTGVTNHVANSSYTPPALNAQTNQPAKSEATETKESMLLHLVEYAMASAPDLSSIPDDLQYSIENGRLKFTEKFSSYGHNFEVTIAMSELAINYIAVAKRMSSSNKQVKPRDLIHEIAPGENHLDGLLSYVDLFADRFHLRYRHPDNVVWLNEFESPYSLETGNKNNRRLFDRELGLTRYAGLKEPANGFVSAVIEALSRHIKNMGELPESSARYFSAHKGLTDALRKLKPPAT